MNDIEAANIAERYSASWYAEIDFIPAERSSSGDGIPRLVGDDLVKAMQANVDDARWNRDGIKQRYEQAEQEGLFDADILETLGRNVRPKWIHAIDVMRGDRARCIAELRHWREYVAWAMDLASRPGKTPQPAPGVADRRLPPEREPGEDDDIESAVAG